MNNQVNWKTPVFAVSACIIAFGFVMYMLLISNEPQPISTTQAVEIQAAEAREQARRFALKIDYLKDPRTGLCFA